MYNIITVYTTRYTYYIPMCIRWVHKYIHVIFTIRPIADKIQFIENTPLEQKIYHLCCQHVVNIQCYELHYVKYTLTKLSPQKYACVQIFAYKAMHTSTTQCESIEMCISQCTYISDVCPYMYNYPYSEQTTCERPCPHTYVHMNGMHTMEPA